MKQRLPLYTKVLSLAFLNLCLLGLAIVLIVRAQFRLDPGSFLLAPAQSRIMNVAHSLTLELEGVQPENWDQVLSRYSKTHDVTFVLFDESGKRVAGPELSIATTVVRQASTTPAPTSSCCESGGQATE